MNILSFSKNEFHRIYIYSIWVILKMKIINNGNIPKQLWDQRWSEQSVTKVTSSWGNHFWFESDPGETFPRPPPPTSYFPPPRGIRNQKYCFHSPPRGIWSLISIVPLVMVSHPLWWLTRLHFQCSWWWHFSVGDGTFTVGDETYTHYPVYPCVSFITNCKSALTECKFLQSVTIARPAIQLTITSHWGRTKTGGANENVTPDRSTHECTRHYRTHADCHQKTLHVHSTKVTRPIFEFFRYYQEPRLNGPETLFKLWPTQLRLRTHTGEGKEWYSANGTATAGEQNRVSS